MHFHAFGVIDPVHHFVSQNCNALSWFLEAGTIVPDSFGELWQRDLANGLTADLQTFFLRVKTIFTHKKKSAGRW